MTLETLAALWDRGVIVLIAVVGYAARQEAWRSRTTTEIEVLKAQRTEDRENFDKVLAEIKSDIRGLRTDIREALTK